MITVFTPVYNRAYILTVLYDSLCKQTFSDFEWLIVNDGSSDNLEELISLFVEENKICIRYFRQKMEENIVRLIMLYNWQKVNCFLL